MSKKSKGTAITLAAQRAEAIAARFAAVEAEATRIHEEQTGARLVRAMLGGNGLHAVISDGKSTMEVFDGQVSLSVKS
jgi:hypothetical protein